MGNGVYTWLPVSTAVQQLAQRLNDPNMDFWVYEELLTYITRALQMQNSLCWVWRTDFQYNDPSNLWNSLGTMAGSPRLRTITDVEVYAELEFMLLEPSNLTGTWTGTNQFSLSVMSQALQRRRDEIIQITNCNQQLLPNIPLTPNKIRTELPDNVIDVERVRYIPGGQLAGGYGTGGYGEGGYGVGNFTGGPSPVTLYRDDTAAQEFYEAPLYQLNPGTPQTFSLSSEPPLSWQVDIPPNQPGTYEAIVLQSGAPFNPPTPTLIGIPDDFVWVLEWGCLADLLGQESEATDRERSAYCLKRYQDGLQLMLKSPWIELGKVNGVAVSCDSIADTDRYDPEFDSNPTGFGPVIVTGGIDFIGAPVGSGIGVTVLGNAPITDPSGVYVQCSRSDMDIIYDLAQARAAFKQGGAEFKAALELEKRALQACMAENVRLKSQGNFSDVLDERGTAQERSQNRYNSKQK
jgi:hypothetical protein